jgi:hypothetical protein
MRARLVLWVARQTVIFLAMIGCGYLLLPTLVKAQVPTFAPLTTYNVGAPPTGLITAADLNGDGLPDVIVGTNLGIAVLMNNGDGTLAAFAPLPTGVPSGMIVADLNGDGRPDVAFGGGGGVGVILNRGDGTFNSPVFYPSNTGLIPASRSLGYGDFFHDGHNHLALVEVGLFGASPTLSIFQNHGDGSFTKTLQIALPAGGESVTAADLNNDGYADLITANGNGSATISVFINNKNGTFAAPTTYTSDQTSYVAAADMNKDGYADLVFVGNNGVSESVEVMINNRDGTFSPPLKTPTLNFISSFTVADFDGDGNLDVAVNVNGVAIHLGKGDGIFAAPVNTSIAGFTVGNSVAADLDGNGATDLVVTNINQNPSPTTIGTALNQRLPPVNLGLRLSTDHGGNTGAVTLTIFGASIPSGSLAKIVCTGQPDTLGTNNTVNAAGTTLTATFNLVGATPDVCSVLIVKPDSSTLTVPQPFTIEQGGAPQLWVDLLGWTSLRAGVAQQYFAVYGNQGTVDASAGTGLWVKFPAFLSYTVSIETPASFQLGTDTYLLFEIGQIPVAGTGVIIINLAAPGSVPAHQPFEVQSWLNQP